MALEIAFAIFTAFVVGGLRLGVANIVADWKR
jgi:hypothetical protein